MDTTFGGVLIAIKCSVEYKIIEKINFTGKLEWIAVEVSQETEPLLIVNVYRPRSKFMNQEDWKKFFSSIEILNTQFVICGDMNAQHSRWGSNVNENSTGVIIENLLLDLEVSVLNDGRSTRRLINRPQHLISVPDLVICSKELTLDMRWDVSKEHMESDHFPMIITWMKFIPFNRTFVRSRYNLNKLDNVK